MTPARPAPTITGPLIDLPRPHPSRKHTLAGAPPGHLRRSTAPAESES